MFIRFLKSSFVFCLLAGLCFSCQSGAEDMAKNAPELEKDSLDSLRFDTVIRAMPTVVSMAGLPSPVQSRLNPNASRQKAYLNENNGQARRQTFKPSPLLQLDNQAFPVPDSIRVNGKQVKLQYPEQIQADAPAMSVNTINDLRCLNVDQGMSSALIIDIIQDRQGFLWIGSDGGGLTRYDGNTFTHFTTAEGLVNDRVNALVEDANGHIWVATFGGLSRFDGESFLNFTEEQGLETSWINDMIMDQSGDFWLATNRGISHLKVNPSSSGEEVDAYLWNYSQEHGISDRITITLIEDLDGNIWWATRENGVQQFRREADSAGGTIMNFQVENGLSGPRARALMADSQGRVWIGTFNNGLNIYHPDSGEILQFSSNNGLSQRHVLSFLEDTHQNIWIGTGDGFDLYQPQSDGITDFKSFSTPEGLSHTNTYVLFEDNHENIWIGTYNGLCIYDPPQDNTGGGSAFRFLSKKNGLLSDKVVSMMEDRAGYLWFGTMGGLHRYDRETIIQYNIPDGLSSQSVRTMMEDQTGHLWFGTERGGLNRFIPDPDRNSGKVIQYQEEQGLTDIHMTAMLQDRKGHYWFATLSDGVNRFIPDKEGYGGTFYQYGTSEGLSNDKTRYLLEDQRGYIWIGTRGGGVSCFIPDKEGLGGQFQHYTMQSGLPHNSVNAMLEDHLGYLWIGTWGGGIARLDPGLEKVEYFTTEDGISSNIIWTFLEDKENRVWLATENGLSLLIRKEEDPTAFQAFTFARDDGLKKIVFEGNSVMLDRNNQAWWGGGFNEGLTMLDLNNFKLAEAAPEVQLNKIELNQRDLDFRNLVQPVDAADDLVGYMLNMVDTVKPFFNYPLELELPFRHNHLTFHFSALDWQAPQKIRYSYRMKGLEADWSPPVKANSADYRSLPHGAYTFQVRAIGAAQVWSPPFEYSFSIRPPWWKTWWARLIYIWLGIIGVYLFIQWRLAIIKNERNEKQAFAEALIYAQEEERKRLARDLHDGVGQSLLFLKKQMEKVATTSVENRALITNTLEEVRSISRDLHPMQLEKFGLTVAIEEIIRKVGDSTDLFLSKEIENIDTLLSPKAEINLYRTIQEALSNVVKHAEASAAKVSIHKADQKIVILIQDNGKGFNHDIAKAESKSLGLRTMSERISSIGGQLSFQKVEPKGTSIQISVPIDNGPT